MTSFNEYRKNKKQISETTVPEQHTRTAHGWAHGADVSPETMKKKRAALGNAGWKIIPLNTNNIADADPDVAEHLDAHGWSTDPEHYAKGHAYRYDTVNHPTMGPIKKIVTKKIGTILEETGASPDTKRSFTNDPGRRSVKSFDTQQKMSVLIGSNPLHIAGASEGTPWHSTSCLNMESGCNSHRLADASRVGSEVAYLIPHNDPTAFNTGLPSNPIARIMVHPMHATKGDTNSDTIMRPESTPYGNANSSFEKTVGDHYRANFPAIHGHTYYKNPSVYDNDKNTTYTRLSKGGVEKSINNGTDIVNSHEAGLDADVIDHAFAHAKSIMPTASELHRRRIIDHLTDIGNLSTSHVAALHKMAVSHSDNRLLRRLAIRHGDKLSTNAISSYVAGKGGNNLPPKLLMNPKLPPGVMDSINPMDYVSVRHHLIKPHHMDKLVDMATEDTENQSDPVFNAISQLSSKLQPHHMEKLTEFAGKSGDYDRGYITSLPQFTQANHDSLMKINPNFALKNSRFATMADAEARSGGIAYLMGNRNASKETQIALKNKMLDAIHRDPHNNSVIPDYMSQHMTDSDYEKLAQSGVSPQFRNTEHGRKFADIDMMHQLGM